eukprot:8468687-Lingulodinium_polyedra.AAC.1
MCLLHLPVRTVDLISPRCCRVEASDASPGGHGRGLGAFRGGARGRVRAAGGGEGHPHQTRVVFRRLAVRGGGAPVASGARGLC